MEVHHVGYLVKDIQAALRVFQALGYKVVLEIIIDDARQAFMALIEMDSLKIELIQPVEESPLAGLLKRYNNSPYHICYSCKNMEREQKHLSEKGFFVLQKSKPAILFNMRKVCFMMHRDLGLIELIDESN